MFQELKSVKQANILKGDDYKEGLNPGYVQVQLEQLYEKSDTQAPLNFKLTAIL